MKLSPTYFKKAGLVFTLALVVGGISAFAQTFTGPSGLAPASSVPTLLNTGSGDQTIAGSFWGASVGANAFSTGGNLWDVEGGISTIHIQQLCLIGDRCITSFPSASSSPTYIAVNGSTCNGSLCAGNAFTGAKICSLNGYSHLVSALGGGPGGSVCGWVGSAWGCDSSCTSSCTSRTLTQVACDNNGTSRLQ
jgi:hypothetical protein